MIYIVNLISSDKNQLEFHTKADSADEAISNSRTYIEDSGWTQYNYVVTSIFPEEQNQTTESLGDRIKRYEAQYEMDISPESEIIVRIDGHHFSAFTKGFDKPFDAALSEAMVRTTEDLLDRFSAYAAYSQSDEITLYIPSLKDVSNEHQRIRDNWTHQFSGRTQKISSLVAAYTTMRFNKHLRDIYVEELEAHREHFEDSFRKTREEDESSKHIMRFNGKIGNAYFDARVFGVPDKAEVFNSFMFRSRDNEKNSKSQFAQAYCNHKELLHKNGAEQIQYTLEKTGKDWNSIEDKYKYGTLVKKELYMKETESGNVQRSRTKRIYQKFTEFSEENVKLICSQYI